MDVGRSTIGDGNAVSRSESAQSYPPGLLERTNEDMAVTSPAGMHILEVTWTDSSGRSASAGDVSFTVVRATRELRFIQTDPAFLVRGGARVE